MSDTAGSPWERGNPTAAHLSVELAGPWYLETETDIWFVYLQKALIGAEAHRTVEKYGCAVVLERWDRYTLEDFEIAAEIVGVDLSQTEAEELATDFMAQHGTQEQFERVIQDD